MTKTKLVLALAALLGLPIQASAADVADVCQPEIELKAGPWEKVESALVKVLEITGTACDEGDPLQASASATAKYTGTCTVSVSTYSHVEGWEVNLLVFRIGSWTFIEDVTSTLKCSGDVMVTVVHSGGLGPRYATSQAGSASFGLPANNAKRLDAPVRQGGGSCPYFAPLTESCKTYHAVGGDYSAAFADMVPELVDICVPIAWQNNLQGAGTLLSSTGNLLPCHEGVEISRIDADLLKSIL